MQLFKLTSILILVIGAIVSFTIFGVEVNAQAIPDCGGQQAIIDLACQRNKILDADFSCEPYICPGDKGGIGSEEEVVDLNFFGVNINAKNGNLLQTLIFVGFNVFLAVATIAAMGIGIWASYIRSRAENDDDIAKSTRSIRNVVVGLVLIVVSFVIAQLIASFLGLGSINDIVDFNQITLDPNGQNSQTGGAGGNIR